MATPERAVWPLPPRPPVLPLPEPMPRPIRMRALVAPALSRMSVSFTAPSLLPVDDAHEVLHLLDHAAHRRSVGQGRGAVELVELEAAQRLALLGIAAEGRADLLDRQGLTLGSHRDPPYASAPAASASEPASRRRLWSVETF